MELYIAQYLVDEKRLRQSMAHDTWNFLAALSKLQVIVPLVEMDTEYINYDAQKRSTIMAKLLLKANALLKTWKMKRDLYKKLQSKMRDVLCHVLIEIIKQRTRPPVASKKKAPLATTTRDVFPEWRNAVQFVQFLSHDECNTYKTASVATFSKSERLRIDALAPLLAFNFQLVPLAVRKQVIVDVISYVGHGISDTERNDLASHLEQLIAQYAAHTTITTARKAEPNLEQQQPIVQQQQAVSLQIQDTVKKALHSNRSKKFSIIPPSAKPSRDSFHHAEVPALDLTNLSSPPKLQHLPPSQQQDTSLTQRKFVKKQYHIQTMSARDK